MFLLQSIPKEDFTAQATILCFGVSGIAAILNNNTIIMITLIFVYRRKTGQSHGEIENHKIRPHCINEDALIKCVEDQLRRTARQNTENSHHST